MIVKLYSVFDSAAQAYNTPLTFQSEGLAIRSFSDAVNKEDSNFRRHAKDYTLFRIGEFDDATGEIKPLSPQAVVNALQVQDYRVDERQQDLVGVPYADMKPGGTD